MSEAILVLDPEATSLVREVREAFAQETGRRAPALSPAVQVEALTAGQRAASVLLAPPTLAAAAIRELDGLSWIQSTWAGVTPILDALRANADRYPTAPILTAAKGLFGPRMAEYVFGWLAGIERRLFTYREMQHACRWQPLASRDLAERTILLAGTGSIGRHLAGVAAAFGMHVIGVSRQGRPQAGFDRVGTPEELHELLSTADFIVSSLPDTPATQQFFDASAFAAMRPEAIFINVGRGAVVDEAALVAALRRGHLRAAVLDVFVEEPLPGEHAIWRTPRLYVTPHIAAVTPRAGMVRLFAQNLDRYLAGQPLQGEVNPMLGY